MHHIANKHNIIKIFVTCSTRQRAIRFIEREFNNSAAQIAENHLPSEKQVSYSVRSNHSISFLMFVFNNPD